MTRDEANEILTEWKLGLSLFPPHVIAQALRVTGDMAIPQFRKPQAEPQFRTVRVWNAPVERL